MALISPDFDAFFRRVVPAIEATIHTSVERLIGSIGPLVA